VPYGAKHYTLYLIKEEIDEVVEESVGVNGRLNDPDGPDVFVCV
jgi:hypothetical protein